MRILITGVAGFIGYNLAKSINSKDVVIDGVDSLEGFYSSQFKILRLKQLDKKINFYELNLSDSISEILNNKTYDLIIHLAAHAGVRNSSIHPQAYVDSNIKAHINILELAKENNASVIYASSSSVYGNNKSVSNELSATDSPLSIYGTTKKTCEMLSQNYFEKWGIKQIGLRFFTVYGRYGRPDMAYWLFTKAAYESKPIEIYGDGTKKRDFTHVSDIVEVIKKIMTEKIDSHDIFNIGRSDSRDINYLADFILSKINKNQKKVYLGDVNEDVNSTLACTEKLSNFIDYKPRISFEDGMQDFIEWFKDNYKSIKNF